MGVRLKGEAGTRVGLGAGGGEREGLWSRVGNDLRRRYLTRGGEAMRVCLPNKGKR